MTASLKAKRAAKQNDTASASTGSTGSRGSGAARRPAKRGVAAVQAEQDNDDKSYDDMSTLPSYPETLTMLGYKHNAEEGYEELAVGCENVEDELWTKGTEGMGFIQAATIPSSVGGVSQDEDAGEWRVQSHAGSNPENKRGKPTRLHNEAKLAKLVLDLEEKPAFIKSILKVSRHVPQVKKGGSPRKGGSQASLCV